MEDAKHGTDNIDEQGNVLYLDEERLNRKEAGFLPYKNKANGLGITILAAFFWERRER